MSDNVKDIHERAREIIELYDKTRDMSLFHQLEHLYANLAELVKLFLISERDTYYGFFFMNMRFEAAFDIDTIAGIRLDAYPPIFLSNPLNLLRFDLQEILYIFCHEVDHVMYNHPSEMLKACPDGDQNQLRLFNIAADVSINDRLNLEIKDGMSFIKQPAGVYTSKRIAEEFDLENVLPLQNYLYYYDLLRSSGIELHDPWQGVAPLPSASKQDEFFGVLDHAWCMGEDVDADSISAAVRQLVNDSNSLMDEETRSSMPGNFLSQLSVINQPPKLPWQSILKQFVGTVATKKRKTQMRLNRRQPMRKDLPGSMDSKEVNIVVALDTSASMSNKDLEYIFNEILAIVSKRKTSVTVIEFDTSVQRVYKILGRRDIPHDAKGRGGTAYTPLIRYINSDRRFRDSLLIIFTDGYGENSIPRPNTYRNLWVVFDSARYLSVKQPYGAVVSLHV